jgi:hypothetical protein
MPDRWTGGNRQRSDTSATVERRVADGFQVGTEAVLVLPPRFVAYFLPGIPVAEVRADEE